MVLVLYTCIDKYNTNDIIDQELLGLPNAARERILKYQLINNRAQCLGAWLLLKKGLEKFSIKIDDYDFEYNQNGKPVFSSQTNLFFSFSHSDHYSICAIANQKIGIDIEKIKPFDYSIIERYFTDDEKKYILIDKEKEKQKKRFFEVWTAKESYLKKEEVGLQRKLSSFNVILDNKIIHHNKMYLELSSIIDEYQICLCYENRLSNSIHFIEA